MKIIKPVVSIESDLNGEYVLALLEKIGRICYKSEEKIASDSAKVFIKSLIDRGHESVIEHYNISVRIVCDRGVTHEIVRHRLASYSQESTRYCNYSKEKFGSELSFIEPNFWQEDKEKMSIWKDTMCYIEKNYLALMNLGATAQEARAILPNSLKTEIVMTMNLREWRHFFKLRTSQAAHPQMREIAGMILSEFTKKVPVIFDDICNN